MQFPDGIQSHDADPQRRRLLGISHPGLPAPRPAQGQPHPRGAGQRGGDAGPGHVTIAAILAFFVSLFGSEKVSPFPRFAKVVRGFATFLRNIPALVWAFILFSSLGIGTGVGFVALCITSFAFMVRAFVETMEDVSQDCVESLQAVGATFPQRVSQAILPSCLSGFLSCYLYCVEVNIRASTIVGMVGGGGVGLTLFSYIKSFQYDIALSIILLVAAMVIIADQITIKLRKELLK